MSKECWIIMQNVFHIWFWWEIWLVLWDVTNTKNCIKHTLKAQRSRENDLLFLKYPLLSLLCVYKLECEHVKSSVSIHMLQRIILCTQGWELALNHGPGSECLRKETTQDGFLKKKNITKSNPAQHNWHLFIYHHNYHLLAGFCINTM